MFRKFLIAICVALLCPIAAGLYGIIHDQFAFSISEEYFTKFKFIQFSIDDNLITNSPRLAVALVGMYATWWTGIPTGITIGTVSLFQKDWKSSLSISLQCIGVLFVVTAVSGLIGLVYAEIFLTKENSQIFVPGNVVDTKNFVAVGKMHSVSYMGGFIGLIAAVRFQFRMKKRDRLQMRTAIS